MLFWHARAGWASGPEREEGRPPGKGSDSQSGLATDNRVAARWGWVGAVG